MIQFRLNETQKKRPLPREVSDAFGYTLLIEVVQKVGF
jgi:hypothetical protein